MSPDGQHRPAPKPGPGQKRSSSDDRVPGASKSPTGGKSLSPDAQRVVQKLQQRDADVRAHEAAHAAAGGQFVRGGPNFTYQTGPDGRHYAIGGEVSIDTSPVKGDPAATVAKMQAVERAALAPADPSGQDYAVAASAAEAEAQARMDQAKSSAAAPPSAGGGKSPSGTGGGDHPVAASPPLPGAGTTASAKASTYTFRGFTVRSSPGGGARFINATA